MTDPMAIAQEMLRRAADRPLGDIVLMSNLSQRPFYSPHRQSADNLFRKAVRARAAGDDSRAERYVQRMLTLPYDDVEEADTALSAARMGVFNAAADLAETADPHNSDWLDAALQALDTCPAGARAFLQRSLAVVAQDYKLHKHELRRVRAALDRYPAPGPDPDENPVTGLSDDERAQLVRDAIQAVVVLGEAVEAL